jgi:hypothetical protein
MAAAEHTGMEWTREILLRQFTSRLSGAFAITPGSPDKFRVMSPGV